jgi:ribokinase
MGKVVVLGSLHMDVMVYAPDRPRKGETLRGSGWGLRCGGKGGNQAVQAAVHGAEVAMISRVGDDDFGQQLLANLRAHGVNTEAVLLDASAGSGMSVAIVDESGDYGAVIVSGVNMHMDAADIARTLPLIQAADVLVLQYEVPLETVALAAQAAASAGTTVVLNAAPAYIPPPDLLPYVDILVANEVEGEMLSGLPITDRQSALAVAERLAQQVRAVILTLGGEGAIIATESAIYHLPAYKVDVVDTHGAGDAFVGALAAQLSSGIPLDTAVRYASAAGALMCAKTEASPEKMQALLAQQIS